MVVGVMFSGILGGLAATICTLIVGFPIWLAVLLYPVIGTLAAICFIAYAIGRAKLGGQDATPAFATECQ